MIFFLNLIGMRQVMASKTFEWPEKGHKTVSDGSKSTIFQY